MEQFQAQQGAVTLDASQQAFQQVAQPLVMQGLPMQFLQPGATQFSTAVQPGQQPQVCKAFVRPMNKKSDKPVYCFASF